MPKKVGRDSFERKLFLFAHLRNKILEEGERASFSQIESDLYYKYEYRIYEIEDAKLLKAVFANPLMPNDWELTWVRALVEIAKSVEDTDKEKKERNAIRKKTETEPIPQGEFFRALIYDFKGDQYEEIEKVLKNRDQCIVRRVEGIKDIEMEKDYENIKTIRWKSFQKIAESMNYNVHFALIHIGNQMFVERIHNIINDIKVANPDALIIISGEVIYKSIVGRHNKGDIIFVPDDKFSEKETIKMAEQKYNEWNERTEKRKTEQAVQSSVSIPAKLELPTKLRVLIIENDEGLAKRYGENMPSYSGTEYEFIVVNDMQQAIEKVGEMKIDYCLADWEGTDVKKAESLAMLKAMFKDSVFGMTIIFGYGGVESFKDDVKADLLEAGFTSKDPLRVIDIFSSYIHFAGILKQARQLQIEVYEKTLAEYEKHDKKSIAAQTVVPTSVQQPIKPEKLIVLCVEDDLSFADSLKDLFGRSFDSENYRFLIATSATEGLDILTKNKVDFVMVDLMELTAELGTAINEVPNITIFSGYFEDDIAKKASKKISSETLSRASILSRWGGYEFIEQIISGIKKARQEQVNAYEKILAEWKAANIAMQPENTKAEPARVQGETIFVLANFSTEAKALAKFIQDEKGGSCNVTPMEGIWYLKRELRTKCPDIIIADTTIDSKDEIANIMHLVMDNNPKAKFIFTSEDAAVTETHPKDENVLAVLEKPFHFRNVLDVIDGTYADRTSSAGVRFKIGESANVINGIEKAHAIDKPGIIKVWEGYAAPQFQKNMLTRIRTKTENSPYQIGFDKDLDNLIDFACQQAKNDNAVTILPSNELNIQQKERLESAGAHVIYIDFKDDVELGTDDIIQLGAIVFTGMAYLNNNDSTLMNLYKLLTGQKHDPVTVEELRKNPSLLTFVLEPVVIHNYNELKHLNDLMEETILKAA